MRMRGTDKPLEGLISVCSVVAVVGVKRERIEVKRLDMQAEEEYFGFGVNSNQPLF
jgi:hypothetical protein